MDRSLQRVCKRCKGKIKARYYIREWVMWVCESCYDEYNNEREEKCRCCKKLRGNQEKWCSSKCQSAKDIK